MRVWAAALVLMTIQPGRSRIATVDVYIDPGGQPLTAYQVELKASDATTRLVLVEGGEGAYAESPYYDPAALTDSSARERVILAAFCTGAAPFVKTRVARLRVEGSTRFVSRVMVAGTDDGREVAVAVTLE